MQTTMQDNRMKNIVLFQVDICVNFYIFSIDGKNL